MLAQGEHRPLTPPGTGEKGRGYVPTRDSLWHLPCSPTGPAHPVVATTESGGPRAATTAVCWAETPAE